MAQIVELREMSDEQLRDKLEDAREELFNLRFQKASARLEDTSRLRIVRREVAQIREVLHKRALAVETAAKQPEIAAALDGKKWHGRARYVYEDTVWEVTLLDENDKELATAQVNLNQKRSDKKESVRERRLVKSFEVTG